MLEVWEVSGCIQMYLEYSRILALWGAEFWRTFDCQHQLPIFLEWTEWVKWIQISLVPGPSSMFSCSDRAALWFQNCSFVFSSLQDMYATIHVFGDICLLLQDSLLCLDSRSEHHTRTTDHEHTQHNLDIKSTYHVKL